MADLFSTSIDQKDGAESASYGYLGGESNYNDSLKSVDVPMGT